MRDVSLNIEQLVEAEWGRYRTIRLRALADAPGAFARTLDEEAAFAPERWRTRLAGGLATFVAVLRGAEVGVVTSAKLRHHDGAAGLFGMWVAPDQRGIGVGTGLVRAIVDWSQFASLEQIRLDVADGNTAAVALYRRLGFEPTGRRGTLPPPRDHITEHERALALR